MGGKNINFYREISLYATFHEGEPVEIVFVLKEFGDSVFHSIKHIGIFEHSPVTVTVCAYPEMDIFVKQRFGDFA
jgi:hypothetical protein